MLRTLKAIQSDPKFELQIVVSDMHLSEEFGKTKDEVSKHFQISASIYMGQKGDSAKERTAALGVCIEKAASVFSVLNPDMLLVLGDRSETLAAVMAAVNMHIPVYHVEGGDKTGNLDDWFRHAITKLSHIHLVAHNGAYEKVCSLGEDPERVYVVGDAHLDLISNGEFTPFETVAAKYNLCRNDFTMVLYHPETLNRENAYRTMSIILEEVKEIGSSTIVIYPCSDQGYGEVVKAIKDCCLPNMKVFKNLEAGDFLGLLSGAKVLVGNSSSGIKEAALFKTPVVNVGLRQEGRLRSENIIDVPYPDKVSVRNALEMSIDPNWVKSLPDNLSLPYGEGRTSEKIMEVLKKTAFKKDLFLKKTF